MKGVIMEFTTIKIPEEIYGDVIESIDERLDEFLDKLGKDFYNDELKRDSDVSYENLTDLDRTFIKANMIAAMWNMPEFNWVVDIYKNYINTL